MFVQVLEEAQPLHEQSQPRTQPHPHNGMLRPGQPQWREGTVDCTDTNAHRDTLKQKTLKSRKSFSVTTNKESHLDTAITSIITGNERG